MSLEEQVKSIQSRDDFVAFVQALIQDLRENDDRWENDVLNSYLEAIAAWTSDMDGYYENRGEPVPIAPDWKLFGQILLAAKYYE